MVKRIIFDIDNTLIMWMKNYDYIAGYQEVLKKNHKKGNYQEAKKLYDVIDFYEQEENRYDKEKLLSFINRHLNENFSMKLIDDINEEIATHWLSPILKEDLDTLKYLSKKYELYALSNWFTDVQEKRLENMKMLSFFKKVIGTDKCLIKPNRKAYEYAMQGLSSNECLFIGDRPDFDLDIPCEMGASGIQFAPDKVNSKYQTISKLSELKNIL